MIRAENLTKYYGTVRAVENLTMEVSDGTILGFLGPNGAGKTTTMRMLTGYTTPTKGRAIIEGLDIQKEPLRAKRLIGYLPEIPPLYPELKVSSFLNFVAEVKGLRGKRKKQEVEKVISQAGLEKVVSRRIRNLSKGYRQRVGIAQALLGNPKVLILDEPTIGLDPKEIVEIRNLIRSLGGERTIILSTHILQEVTSVCDSIAIINEGRLIEFGKIEEVQQKYGSASLEEIYISAISRGGEA